MDLVALPASDDATHFWMGVLFLSVFALALLWLGTRDK
jgi:hypothetical protein